MTTLEQPLLGAHVSAAGGVHNAPARGRAIGANVIQVFTKTPNQWREPRISDEMAVAFQDALHAEHIHWVLSHDSYLINLASPDRFLRQRSIMCFRGELERCRQLGIPYVVTHPGNFIDDHHAGLQRNAEAYDECLDAVPGPMILLETTAGTGTALGARFDELADLRSRIAEPFRSRVGFCADTCHLHAAGYDIVADWDGVWDEWHRTIGLEHLRALHLNDSKTPLGSHRDRHELIGEGTLGKQPFRTLMRDARFADVLKVIETPKGDDPIKTDRRMMRRLKAYARTPQRVPAGTRTN